jgi:putative ABC transport system substrate-binding protein
MRRRDFFAVVGGMAAGWPLGVRAQQPDRMRRLGILVGLAAQTDSEGQARVAAFLEALQAFGWTPGRNIQVVIRWSAGDVALVKPMRQS